MTAKRSSPSLHQSRFPWLQNTDTTPFPVKNKSWLINCYLEGGGGLLCGCCHRQRTIGVYWRAGCGRITSCCIYEQSQSRQYRMQLLLRSLKQVWIFFCWCVTGKVLNCLTAGGSQPPLPPGLRGIICLCLWSLQPKIQFSWQLFQKSTLKVELCWKSFLLNRCNWL